jgi:hypothetical protein
LHALREAAIAKVITFYRVGLKFCNFNCRNVTVAPLYLQEIEVKPVVNRLLPPRKEGKIFMLRSLTEAQDDFFLHIGNIHRKVRYRY